MDAEDVELSWKQITRINEMASVDYSKLAGGMVEEASEKIVKILDIAGDDLSDGVYETLAELKDRLDRTGTRGEFINRKIEEVKERIAEEPSEEGNCED